MMKAITLAAGLFVFGVLSPLQLAHAGECTAGLFMRVQTNLEYTMNDAGMKGCAFAKIHGGTPAWDAFADCNPKAFRDGGLFNPLHNDYVDCKEKVCKWFREQRLDPSC